MIGSGREASAQAEMFTGTCNATVVLKDDQILANMRAVQAFTGDFKEDGNKASRIIFGTPDEFGSRRPIDMIAANRPILILDEPQRLKGPKVRPR